MRIETAEAGLRIDISYTVTSEPARRDHSSSYAIHPDHKYSKPHHTPYRKHNRERIYLQKKASNGPGGESRRAPPRPRIGGTGGGGGAWGLLGLDSPRDSAASRTIRLREKF